MYIMIPFFKNFTYTEIHICTVMVNFWGFLSFWGPSDRGSYSISYPSEMFEYFLLL